jgi:hypothetical protein
VTISIEWGYLRLDLMQTGSRKGELSWQQHCQWPRSSPSAMHFAIATKQAEEQLHRQREEELVEFRKRLDNFKLTDEIIQSGLDRIKRAFERGETELMFSSFPSSFCTDNGRAIISAGVPPINKPSKEEVARQAEQPDWLLTLPSGVHQVFDYWKANLKPGGFKFEARIINYPGGMPGDVGLFFSWPKHSEA